MEKSVQNKNNNNYAFPRNKLKPPSIWSQDKQQVVLVACGSFSPVTYLHLRLFEIARDWIRTNVKEWEVVGGYMSPVNDGYGKKGLGESHHRNNMVQLALESSDWIMCDDWETRQDGWQRTIIALNHFKTELNKDYTSDRVIPLLLCGADLIESFNKPGVWEEQDMKDILANGVVCVTRVGVNIESIIYHHPILYEYQKQIKILHQWISNDISSTSLRLNIQRGLSIKYLTPDNVIEYIVTHKLYGCDPKFLSRL